MIFPSSEVCSSFHWWISWILSLVLWRHFWTSVEFLTDLKILWQRTASVNRNPSSSVLKDLKLKVRYFNKVSFIQMQKRLEKLLEKQQLWGRFLEISKTSGELPLGFAGHCCSCNTGLDSSLLSFILTLDRSRVVNLNIVHPATYAVCWLQQMALPTYMEDWIKKASLLRNQANHE